MWKRIHSNRDPRDTLYSEILKEFGPYFSVACCSGKKIAQKHPKVIWGCMILLLLFSAILSFTLFRVRDKSVPTVTNTANPMREGLSKILHTTNQINEILALKKVIDSISGKRHLNTRDSVVLDSTLDRLQAISKP